jgi:hypothetical protein
MLLSVLIAVSIFGGSGFGPSPGIKLARSSSFGAGVGAARLVFLAVFFAIKFLLPLLKFPCLMLI